MVAICLGVHVGHFGIATFPSPGIPPGSGRFHTGVTASKLLPESMLFLLAEISHRTMFIYF
jgi:hypothetical protein